jgi:hypothetical protein
MSMLKYNKCLNMCLFSNRNYQLDFLLKEFSLVIVKDILIKNTS